MKVNFPSLPTLSTVIDTEDQEFLPRSHKDQLNTAKKNVLTRNKFKKNKGKLLYITDIPSHCPVH